MTAANITLLILNKKIRGWCKIEKPSVLFEFLETFERAAIRL